jgi:hypothetical protein
MRKYLILLPLIVLSLCSCAGTLSTPTTATSAVVSAQDAAEKSLYAVGVALQAAPGVMDALYKAGKLSKDDFNSAVPIYNRALASYQVAVSALKAAVTAGQDPTQATGYVSALNTFLADKGTIDNLLTAFGSKPVGTN